MPITRTPEMEAMLADKYIDWSLIPEHMHESVARYVVHNIKPGDFLRLMLSHDVLHAALKADDLNAIKLREWIIFIYNFLPSGCHGSPEIVEAWIKE